MTTQSIAITPETLPAIMWQNQPVITTELLAEIYGTAVKNIQMNFTNNANRFIEGVHYFVLKGADLKEFKLQPNGIGSQISNMVRKLYLWTERGTVRHAKILDTDNAWAVQDRLEDFYFTKHQPVAQLLESPTITKAQYGELNARVCEIAPDGKTRMALWSRFNNHFRISSYKNLPSEKYDDALLYLEQKKALLEPEMKQTSLQGYASMILGLPNDDSRVVVQNHNGVTVVMNLAENDFVGTFETIVRELKFRGYLVIKNEPENKLETIGKIVTAKFEA